MAKRQLRTAHFNIAMTPKERKAIDKAAKITLDQPSVWARSVLLEHVAKLGVVVK